MELVATSLDPTTVARITARLSEVDQARTRRYPGENTDRQPVHTCYVPADLVQADLVRDWGLRAADALTAYAGTVIELAELAGLPDEIAEQVYPRVVAKLNDEPIEDLRIDFEDGYGAHDDTAEDADARRTARLLGQWWEAASAPPYVGIRIKSFDTVVLRQRGIRTLDVFCTSLLDLTGGVLPTGFVVTVPKVSAREQIEVCAELLDVLESSLGLPSGSMPMEIQVETTQSILDSDGRIALPGLLAAGGGRVRGLHFGTYDYTAALGLPSGAQHLAHRACDFARHVMQVATAGTGVWCSDGSTNVLPVGDQDTVRFGWRTHAGLVRRSLEHGFYQGWDLHPHQLVTRYATVFGFYRAGLADATDRLAVHLGSDRPSGPIADEPATIQMLARFLLRAVRCGACDDAELRALTGHSTETLAQIRF